MLYTKSMFEESILEEERMQKSEQKTIAKIKKIVSLAVFSVATIVFFYWFLYNASGCIL